MHVRRRMFLGKRLHNGHRKTLLFLNTWVNLLTCVMRLRGATRFYAERRRLHAPCWAASSSRQVLVPEPGRGVDLLDDIDPSTRWIV
jgi:hypothetical protein